MEVLFNMKSNEFTSIMLWVKNILEALGKEYRWNKDNEETGKPVYPEKDYMQSIKDHSLFMVILAEVCVSMEEKQDFFFPKCGRRIISHFATHNLGEILTGDILFPKKIKMGEEYKEKELYSTHIIIQQLPWQIANPLWKVFDKSQFSQEEKDFIDALERLEYLLYASYEYFMCEHKDFAQVFLRQFEKVAKHAKKFSSIAFFFNGIKPKIEEVIEKTKNRI